MKNEELTPSSYSLGIKAKGRRIEKHPEELCVLREASEPYNDDFTAENEALSVENAFFWGDFCGFIQLAWSDPKFHPQTPK